MALKKAIHKKCFALPLALLLLFPAGIAQGAQDSGWSGTIADHANLPARLIVVDKSNQQVLAYKQSKAFERIKAYPCTTGQKSGDKKLRGDLKTPEGVYFVTGHITSGLDYALYGKEAYPLNYPNPVDKYRKKTGSGIWLHGKGVPLVRQDTRGCVGMTVPDMRELGATIVMGQPVAMAEKISESKKADAARLKTVAKLRQDVQDWAKAWSDRSTKMFDYYNPEAYSIAQRQSFDSFRKNKERLFNKLPWIDTKVSDIQIMEGPGYWVTWFNQSYRTPNMSTTGTRRLYWMPDKNGNLRIMGMEWVAGLKTPTLVASASSTGTDATPTKTVAEKKPTAADIAVQEAQKAAAKRAEQEKQLAAAKKAAELAAAEQAKQEAAQKAAEAKKLADAQKAAAKKAAEIAKKEAEAKKAAELAAKKAAEAAEAKKLAAAKKAAEAAEKAYLQSAGQFIENWRSAWEKGNLNKYQSFYAENAVQGNNNGATAIVNHKRGIWASNPPVQVKMGKVRITKEGELAKAEMLQHYTNKRGYSDIGKKTILLKPHGTSWLIIREDWSRK